MSDERIRELAEEAYWAVFRALDDEPELTGSEVGEAAALAEAAVACTLRAEAPVVLVPAVAR